MRLTWRFTDGRSCADAGVIEIEASTRAKLWRLACTDGEAGRAVALPDPVEEGGSVALAALSGAGAPLYRGSIRVGGAIDDPALVILFFTGGR